MIPSKKTEKPVGWLTKQLRPSLSGSVKYSFKSKINSSTHKLRKDGYPIISGLGKKGYRYADEDCDDFIEMWDEALSSREKRKTNLEKEYDTYEKLIQKIIEKLIAKGRLQESEKLKQVLVKYSR